MCDQDFFRAWNVEYLDEPEFNGRMDINRRGGRIFVSGSINQNGRLAGAYTAQDAVCSGATFRRMRFTYRLASGNTGRLTLNLSVVSNTNIIINGNYVDDGRGGDSGRIRMTPVILDANRVAENFTFDDAITDEQRRRLIERHQFAYSRIGACANLAEDERTALRLAYGRAINHGIDSDPNNNASAIIGGSDIFINFGNLFPQGNDEIAQTLIHEMMHCAGFDHPMRMATDTPGDGGLYYGSAPLQSELCIAGRQSDTFCSVNEKGVHICGSKVLDSQSVGDGFASPTVANHNIFDRLRGMLLLGAYGDALGAVHEGSREIAPAPFPKPLPVRRMLNQGSAWGTWLPNTVVATKAGVPTDDTCYRMFLLHPWLQAIASGNSTFTEKSFREFLLQLAQSTAKPNWTQLPRNNQINAWIEMFKAEEEGGCSFFFCPDVPIVFGLFMYLETGAIIQGGTMESTYRFFKGFSRLDQRYAISATAFMTTLLSQAIEYNCAETTFDEWFFSQSSALFQELKVIFPDDSDVAILENLFSSMRELGVKHRGSSEETFVSAFKTIVIDPDFPPFMDTAFSGIFDPFRFIAQIVATVEFSAGDPAIALRAIAYSIGDTDTTATFLGSLMGAWFGEKQLRNLKTPGLILNDELNTVEDVLDNLFEIDLDERARLFELLRFRKLGQQS